MLGVVFSVGSAKMNKVHACWKGAHNGGKEISNRQSATVSAKVASVKDAVIREAPGAVT